MTTGQFQLESDFVTAVNRPARLRTAPNTPAGMASLLIGLGLRTWLSDTEKEFLDHLAPDHFISFLMHGNEYIHPEGVELFSIEQIGSKLLASGAVFSQQHRMNRLRAQSSQVHTSYLGELDGRGLIFGIAGPDNTATCTDVGDRFACLAQQFRTAVGEVESALTRLRTKLGASSPLLAINRCSGRIVAANDAACKLLGQDEREIVGLEFSSIKRRLTPALAGNKISMESVECGDVSLSMLSVISSRTSDSGIVAVLPNFLHCLRRASSALQMTSHHLGTIVSHQPGHPEAELVHILDEEAAELDQTIRRFHLLAEYDQFEKSPVNPAEELRQVVNVTATRRPERRLTLIEHWEDPVQLSVPSNALLALYEVILQVHFGQTCRCSTTDVVVSSDVRGHLSIVFSTQAPTVHGAMQNRAEWITYCSALATLMGLQCVHVDGATIETTLTYSEK